MAAIITMDTAGLIENRNLELWTTLNTKFKIDIIKEDRDSHAVFIKSGSATIYVPLNPQVSAFTHELLHIFLTLKEIYIGEELALHVKKDATLSKFMSDNLTDHIGNCLEHIKMLPEYLKMGFKREDFIVDYSINKLNAEEVRSIRTHFKRRPLFQKVQFDSKAIDLYIGKYFAVKACPNLTFNYESGLNELMKINSDLYAILERFVTDWEKYDYNDRELITDGYDDILLDLTTGLRDWGKNKNIV
ncbi:MAG: hypothetical protein O9294_18560 [Cytophagales bacterium]|nr:hypothetical protein [Cytophagales bacterium]